jgi:hypothetical protein
LNALHLNVARQMLTVMRIMRERVWAAANVKLEVVTIDTDTTVHTLYGQQMGGRKGYNPKNKAKKSYQPMLTFIAETREYVWGELRNGDRPSGKQIGDHLRNVHAALPPAVKRIYGRADSGFYCREAVEAYEEFDAWFVICARKTSRLVEELRHAEWKPSPKTDADAECEFRYQPDGWSKPYRFVALRYEKTRAEREAEETEQYQLFDTSQYKYRVFVTDMPDPIYFVVWFYSQEAEPRGRQSRMPQFGGVGLRFAVEQHQPAVQVLRQHGQLEVIAVHGPGPCASDGPGVALKNIRAGPSSAVHRTLCAGGKRNGASDFDAGLGGSGVSGGRWTNANRTDLLNSGRHQPSAAGARNARRVHNSGVQVDGVKPRRG